MGKPSREVMLIRDSVIDGLRIAGSLFLVRQKYTMRDIESGEVERCPYCWDEVLKQSNNSRCPHCFGSGLSDGGYKPLSMVRGYVSVNGRDYEEKHETQGVREVQDMTMKLPFEPLFHSGDVFAEVITMEDGAATQIGRIFQIAGEVTWKTLSGLVSNSKCENITDLRSRIVSQEAGVRLLLATDEKYLSSDEFWGISSANVLHNPDMTGYDGLSEIGTDEPETRRHSAGWLV